MNKQEAIEKIEDLERLTILDKAISFEGEMIPKSKTLDIVRQINEPEKPTIPSFVAEHIEYHKSRNSPMGDIFNRHFIDDERIETWLRKVPNAYNDLGKAWLFGYEVEEEKLYTARLKITTIGYVNYINRRSADGAIILSNLNTASGNYQTSFTQSELEELGIWNNPTFEIEGVSNE